MPPPKNARLAYLKRRGNTWHLHYPIPAELRHHYPTASGKHRTHIDKALQTADPDEAYRRKLVELTAIEAEFRTHRRGDRGTEPESLRQAKSIREAIREASNADNFDAAETYSLVASDYADRIDEEGGHTRASRRKAETFMRIAHGAETVREAFKEWMAAGTLPARTQEKYRMAVDEFAAHVGGEPLLSDINDETALTYVDWLNREARSQRTKRMVPLSFNTKRDRVMALSAFWNTWLLPRRKVKGASPFSRLQVTEKPTPSDIRWASTENTGRPKRRPYFDEADLLAILDAPGPRQGGATRYPKRTLMEVLALGLLTGARPDEVCSLKLEDIRKVPGGYSLHFADPKNAESIRRIPMVHPVGVAVIQRRVGDRTDPKAQLFAEFRSKEGHDNLAELVLRALNRHLERATGLTPGAVPYCTRHTFATTVGGMQGVQRVVMQRYIGHKPQDITDRHYQDITPAQLLGVARVVSYGAAVEQRMREELALPSGD
jgi:integrase